MEEAKEDFIRAGRGKVVAMVIRIGYVQLLIRLMRNAENFEEVKAIG